MSFKIYTANSGTSDAFQVDQNRLLMEIDGTIGGATFKLQRSLDGGNTFRDYPDANAVAITAVCNFNAYVAPGIYHVVWTGGTGTSVGIGLYQF